MGYTRNGRSRFVTTITGAAIWLIVQSQVGGAQEPIADPEDSRPWAVYGEIVTEDGAKSGWLVFDRGGISKVHCPKEELPEGARIVEHDGYIFPGLIDTHNHAQWNSIPQWRAGHTFKNRYEWQKDPEYLNKVRSVYYDHLQAKGAEYASLKYAQVRALIGGATAIQSTYTVPEPPLLIRKLDAHYWCDSRIPNIMEISEAEVHRFRTGLAAGQVRRIFLHIAEGRSDDPQSSKEFESAQQKGLARPGIVVIHGIALARSDFKKMSKVGMFLVWSPKSNMVLYNETAKILDALEAKVTVALAPDWTITGSNNMLDELKYAQEYSKRCASGRITARQLYRMVTSDAAKVAGMEERLGQLAFGYAADLFLAPKLDPDPFVSLLKTTPRQLRAVFVDGVPLYGDPKELKKWITLSSLDSIEVEQSEKVIMVKGDPRSVWHSRQHFADVLAVLRETLPSGPAPLIEK